MMLFIHISRLLALFLCLIVSGQARTAIASQSEQLELLEAAGQDLKPKPGRDVANSDESVAEILGLRRTEDNQAKISKNAAEASVSIGLRRLSGTLEHDKDDDRFASASPNNTLFGANIGLRSRLSDYKTPVRLSYGLAANIGYFGGKALVRRSGIENYDYELQYHLLPFALSFGAYRSIALGQIWLEIAMNGGLEAVLINQVGLGDLDTVSSIRYGEVIGFTFAFPGLPLHPFLSFDAIGYLLNSPSSSFLAMVGTRVKIF